MKKNKTLAYALAATLLVGGTFAGTKALFSDEEKVKSDLVITTGSIDIEVTESEWQTDGLNAKINNNHVGDVAPGDILTKTITVENSGSLDRTLEVTGGKQINGTENYTITTPGLDKIKDIPKGQNATFDIVVQVNPDMENDDSNLGGNGDTNHSSPFSPGENMEPIVIKATQKLKK